MLALAMAHANGEDLLRGCKDQPCGELLRVQKLWSSK